nr:hypothetical protein [Tanacetum cinerariifolium]
MLETGKIGQLGASSGMGEWVGDFSGQVAGRGWGKTCAVDWAGKGSRGIVFRTDGVTGVKVLRFGKVGPC